MFTFWRRLIGSAPAQAPQAAAVEDDRRLWLRSPGGPPTPLGQRRHDSPEPHDRTTDPQPRHHGLDHDPDDGRAAFRTLPVVLAIPHAVDCPATFGEADRNWFPIHRNGA